MSKYDKKFIKNNLEELIIASFKNAEKQKVVAITLAGAKEYSSAFLHILTALEELIKANHLSWGYDNERVLKEITNHDKKSGKIYALSASLYMTPNRMEGIKKAEKRFPELRENALYVSLKTSNNGKFYPDDIYYKKRYEAFLRLYNMIVKTNMFEKLYDNIINK